VSGPEEFAFPRPGQIGKGGAGMTLRDYFAAKVLIGTATADIEHPDRFAEWCYVMADAMLEARSAKCD
jgi:hypothetical protein